MPRYSNLIANLVYFFICIFFEFPDITSPVKVNSPGMSKTAYTHISNLHTLLSNWTSIRDKGLKICKSLSSLKLHECENDYYPHQTKQLVDGLLEALDALENIVDGKIHVNLLLYKLFS